MITKVTSEGNSVRSPELGVIKGLAKSFGSDFSVELFRRGMFARAFELKVREALERKIIQIPVYLSVGQEFNAAALSMVLKDFDIFPQHRGHSLYLCMGGDPHKLRDELLGKSSGCAGGMSGSNAIHCPERRIFGHSGLLGEQVPVAVGSALGSGHLTATIAGDAAVEEDYFYPAIGFAMSHKLPILFICEDNNLSILTPVAVRRKWSIVDLAASFKIPAIDITDDPWLIAHHVRELGPQLPALINIRTVRNLWHAGFGCDGAPEWNRFEMICKELRELGLGDQMDQIIFESQKRADEIWAEQLQRQ